MNREGASRTFERPISVLQIGDRELTGALALIAYTLLSASKGRNDFVPHAELVASQRDVDEPYASALSRVQFHMKNIVPLFKDAGVEIEVKKLPGNRGWPQSHYRLVPAREEAVENLQKSATFSIQEGEGYQDRQGRKNPNPLLQLVIREKKPMWGEIVLAEGVPEPASLTPSFENTQRFFSAISLSIDENNLPKPFVYRAHKAQPYERWLRNWRILGRHLGTDAVLEETGEHYGITRERVRQVAEKFVNLSHKASPEVLKEAFPREILSIQKPYALNKGTRISEIHKRRMQEEFEAINAGKSNIDISSRATLYRKYGINVPYVKEASGREYQKSLRLLAEGLLDDNQVANLFKEIEDHNRYAVCKGLREEGVLVAVRNAARNEGVFLGRSNGVVYRLLKELAIPIVNVIYQMKEIEGRKRKTLSYTYVLNNHERTREAFKNEFFDKFRKHRR